MHSSDIQVNYKLHLCPALSKLMNSIDQRKGGKIYAVAYHSLVNVYVDLLEFTRIAGTS